MATYYFDTSALVKLYVEEPGTERVLELTRYPDRDTYAVLDLSRVEFRAAIRARERRSHIPKATAEGVLKQFEQHLEGLLLVQPVTASVVEEAAALVDRHPLRAYDALQLAGCLALQGASPSGPPLFVCADKPLVRAAEREGVGVINPDEHFEN